MPLKRRSTWFSKHGSNRRCVTAPWRGHGRADLIGPPRSVAATALAWRRHHRDDDTRDFNSGESKEPAWASPKIHSLTYARALSNAAASFKSRVSKPSVNQPKIGASNSVASVRLPVSPHNRARLMAARSS